MLGQYITQHYDALEQMAKNITKGRHPDWEDLLHIALEAIWTADREKMDALVTKRQLRYWVARIMLNQYNSTASKYHYLYRNEDSKARKAQYDLELSRQDTVELMEYREHLLDEMHDHLATVPEFERLLTTLYYMEDHSFTSLAQATGISRTTIYKAIKRARHEIREKLGAG